MPEPLLLRANLEWLKKEAKSRLLLLRQANADAQLSDAQLALARDYGFSSWRKLHEHVSELRTRLDQVPMASAGAPAVTPNDPDLLALLKAVRDGDLRAATELLGRRPELSRGHGPEGQTPLHVAAQCNDNRMATYLLASGADANATYGESRHTAMSWAVTCNAIAFAKTLVQLGQKPDLFCAAGMGSLGHVKSFFGADGTLLPNASRTGSSRVGADGMRLPCPPETPAEQLADALYVACRNAQEEVVRYLLTRSPDLSFRAYLGGTALHWAYFGGSKTIIDLLTKAGADSNVRDHAIHCTPRAFGICVAVNWSFSHLVRKRLAEDPTLVNVMDGHVSPLREAVRLGNLDIVQLLLGAGADPLLVHEDGMSAVDVAVEKGHPAVVELLRNTTNSK